MLKIPTRGRNLRSSGRPDVVLHKVLQISLVKVMRFRLAVNGAKTMTLLGWNRGNPVRTLGHDGDISSQILQICGGFH